MPIPCINPQTKYQMQQEFPINVLDDEYLARISQEHVEQKTQKSRNSIIVIVQLTSIEQM